MAIVQTALLVAAGVIAAGGVPVSSLMVQPPAPITKVEAEPPRPYPVLVTAQTRADKAAVAALEKPGELLFSDGFETVEVLNRYFEVQGAKEGLAAIVTDVAATGKGSLRLTAKNKGGASSGASAHLWFGARPKEGGAGGYERIYMRYRTRFAEDYDQGNLNHTGGSLSAVAGDNKWSGMGGAGLRPAGDDNLSSRVEPWKDWGRLQPPGYLFCYVYWMDMKLDKDGNYWGNMLGPAVAERFVPQRGTWYCVEQMIKLNTFTEGRPNADGELAVWLDGVLYQHYTGFRWRSSEAVRLKRASLMVYIHKAERDNTVWYDDLAISTGYIGPAKGDSPAPAATTPPASTPASP